MYKAIITNDLKKSKQVKEHSIYLIRYLRSLLLTDINEEIKEEDSRMEDDEPGSSSVIRVKIGIGMNDKYLIKKLNESDITVHKIDAYLSKLQDIVTDDSMGEGEGTIHALIEANDTSIMS